MIKSFQHRGVQQFFETGSIAGIQARHAARLRLQLAMLDGASSPVDMDLPNWRLHRLRGDLEGHWSVWVDKSWRLTFRFEGPHAILVDYQNYH